MWKVVMLRLASAYASLALEVSVVIHTVHADTMENHAAKNVIARTMDPATSKQESVCVNVVGMGQTAIHHAGLENMA